MSYSLCYLFALFAMGQVSPHYGPLVPALGRPLSWDAYGAYPLDAETPLTPASRQIVKDLMDAELGRAESLARYRMQVDKNDLVPAWALAQIVRVRKGAMAEYGRSVAPHVTEPAPRPVRLYRYYICRTAYDEFMRGFRGGDSPTYRALDRDLRRLRDRSQSDAANSLPLTIALAKGGSFWVLENRAILEAYRPKKPDGPDLRPLICRAYLDGVEMYPKAYKNPDAPAPERALEVARSILRDRPKDPFGLYYRGRCQSALGKTPEAVRDVKAALDTGSLPPLFERVARTFLSDPRDRVFYSIAPVD